MAEYDNRNRVAVWANNKKADNHPDYRGTVNVEGVDYDIALWNNKSSNPKAPKLSGKISEPYNKGETQDAPPF